MTTGLIIPTQQELAHQWAEITIMRWIERMADLNVGKTGALKGSFEFQVNADPSGMLKSITLFFLYYGRFPDMGVGKGMGIESVKENRSKWASALGENSKRVPKKWYSPVFTREYNRLMELLIEYYQIDLIKTVKYEGKLLSENKAVRVTL